MVHGRPAIDGRPGDLFDHEVHMATAKLGQRLQRFGEEIRSARLGFERQGDNRLRASGEDFDDFVLRSREVGEAVEDNETEESGKRKAESGSLTVLFHFRLSAFRFLQDIPRRPEPAFGVEQAALAQRLLISGIDFGQFDVLVAGAPRLAGAMELFRPDLQPLQLADELAHQVHQPAGRGDRLEMPEPARRELPADDLANQLAFHQAGQGTNRQPGGVQDRFREPLEGYHAGTEAAAKAAVEQPPANVGRRPPRGRQPERASRRLFQQCRTIAREEPRRFSATGGAKQDSEHRFALDFADRLIPLPRILAVGLLLSRKEAGIEDLEVWLRGFGPRHSTPAILPAGR